MAIFNLLHFQNACAGREPELRAWLAQRLLPGLMEIPGVQAVRTLALQETQLQPTLAQPWRLATLTEVDAEDLSSVLSLHASQARRAARDAGLIQGDACHVFEMTRPHVLSPQAVEADAPLHLCFVMGNCVLGREADYDEWYDQVHTPEILGAPGFSALRRGVLSPLQSSPANDQPANRLVLHLIRTHDLSGALAEFVARARGASAAGIAWAPREHAASFASLQRTTHVFTPF